MGLSEFEIKKYEFLLTDFIEVKRPPIEIRNELDVSYRIENQSIYIFEIRPEYQNPANKIEIEIAKATYVKNRKQWKLFWMRADLKWHGYEPGLYSDSLEEVLVIVDNDEYACFWG